MTGIGGARHRVIVQAPGGVVPDGDGGYVEGWDDLPPPWDVEILPVSARDLERLGAGTVIATATHVIRGRYRSDVAIDARLIFAGRAFVIVGVRNVEERGIRMECYAKEAI